MDNKSSEVNQSGYIDLSYLKKISGNDQSFILEMIETYLNNVPIYIEEMKSLIINQKLRDIGDITHKMTPSIGFMGIHQLKDTIQQLQISGRELKNISEIPVMVEEIERVNKIAMVELHEKLTKKNV